MQTLTPGERLFLGLTRWQADDVHRDRLKALGLVRHRLHDAGHFYAVLAKTSQAPVSDWPANSRGGTRTHDPGIMSAVL